jgi:hypothetical protein
MSLLITLPWRLIVRQVACTAVAVWWWLYLLLVFRRCASNLGQNTQYPIETSSASKTLSAGPQVTEVQMFLPVVWRSVCRPNCSFGLCPSSECPGLRLAQPGARQFGIFPRQSPEGGSRTSFLNVVFLISTLRWRIKPDNNDAHCKSLAMPSAYNHPQILREFTEISQ